MTHPIAYLVFFASCISLVACGPSRDDLKAREKHVKDFCKNPKPLQFAPETPQNVVNVFIRNNDPNAPPGHHSWLGVAQHRWMPSGYKAADRDKRYILSTGSYVACVFGDHKVLEKKQYFLNDSIERTIHRTVNHTHLTVYEARTAKKIHDVRFKGSEPEAFPSSFNSDQTLERFSGKTNIEALKKELEKALP